MHDVPTASPPRRGRRTASELGHSGLIGSALAGTRPSPAPRAATPRTPEVRPSDAVIAECTCPEACIRDHEHE